MEILFKVFMLALQIYLGGTGVIGFIITCYGLCYPNFFVANRKVLGWAAIAWLFGSVSCTVVLGIAAVFTCLI